jgi:hypothetical protein
LDSVHDAGVYSFMLEELEAATLGYPTNNPDRVAACQHIYERKGDTVKCTMCGGKPESEVVFPDNVDGRG